MSAGIAAFAAIVLAGRALGAQDVSARGAVVTVAVAPDTVGVGEPFVVRVRVRAPKSATLRFPALPDSGDAVEALDPRAIEDAPDETVLDQTAVYRVAAWNVGSHAAHFAPVVVSMGGSAVPYAIVAPPVFVRAVLPADTSQQVPKDAREPFPALSGLWRWLLVAAIVAALTAWYLVRRRRHGALPARAAPEAYVATAAAFRALEALALADAGETGRHVIAHVDVLRAYLARRFPAAGVALTPAEMHAALAASDFPVLPERVDELLARDAAIRFAHERVTKAEAVALAAEARAIARDVQDAYEARLRAAERGPQRPARR
ncbi:MAG: hypothetical protein HY084_04670 [Gemmatimonadetes bacterium]|nr:hypothetical protein [Gemmatimonadota bacterium]